MRAPTVHDLSLVLRHAQPLRRSWTYVRDLPELVGNESKIDGLDARGAEAPAGAERGATLSAGQR